MFITIWKSRIQEGPIVGDTFRNLMLHLIEDDDWVVCKGRTRRQFILYSSQAVMSSAGWFGERLDPTVRALVTLRGTGSRAALVFSLQVSPGGMLFNVGFGVLPVGGAIIWGRKILANPSLPSTAGAWAGDVFCAMLIVAALGVDALLWWRFGVEVRQLYRATQVQEGQKDSHRASL